MKVKVTELYVARDKIKYKDTYLKYAFFFLMRNHNPRN